MCLQTINDVCWKRLAGLLGHVMRHKLSPSSCVFSLLSLPLTVRQKPPCHGPRLCWLLAAAPEPQHCRRGREVINNPGRGAETAGRCTVWPDKYSLENHQRARAHPKCLEPAFQTWAAKYIGLPLLEKRKEDKQKSLPLLPLSLLRCLPLHPHPDSVVDTARVINYLKQSMSFCRKQGQAYTGRENTEKKVKKKSNK